MTSADSPGPLAPHRIPRPEPGGGWSRTVMRLRDAVIDPGDCGVWSEGRLCPEAMLYRWGKPYRGHRGTAVPADPSPLAGRHLWGGMIFFHFGHFLAESLPRLWAASDSGAASILFTPKNLRGKRASELVGFQKQIMASLGIKIPVRILYEPVRVEELIIPGQGFGLGALAPGTPEFRSFARRMDPGPSPAPDGARKLYISRSALPKKTGSILAEAGLERMLQSQGFEIYHPQQHSIAHQLRRFRDTTHFLGPDGSAFHLAGFIAQPHQTFTLIKRRSAREYVTFIDQLKAMKVRAEVIDALAANWVNPRKGKPDDMSWGELDFGRLSGDLLRLGLITEPLDASPSPEAELQEIAAANRNPLTRIPVQTAAPTG